MSMHQPALGRQACCPWSVRPLSSQILFTQSVPLPLKGAVSSTGALNLPIRWWYLLYTPGRVQGVIIPHEAAAPSTCYKKSLSHGAHHPSRGGKDQLA